MTPEEEEDFQKAIRCIQEAEKTGAVELDLSGLALNRLPPELGRLTSLQSLDLSYCRQLSGNLAQLRQSHFPPIARPHQLDAVFLADRKRSLGHESGPGSQNPRDFTDRRENILLARLPAAKLAG
jgi:hypothetical protein